MAAPVYYTADTVRDLWDWHAMKAMLLAVEIPNPSNLRADRVTKRRLYQEVGVPLYCVVDGGARAVEVWRPELHFPEPEHERIVWHPTGASAPAVTPRARQRPRDLLTERRGRPRPHREKIPQSLRSFGTTTIGTRSSGMTRAARRPHDTGGSSSE